jgi:hypothetical protein
LGNIVAAKTLGTLKYNFFKIIANWPLQCDEIAFKPDISSYQSSDSWLRNF